MAEPTIVYFILFMASLPFLYYALTLGSSWQFFREGRRRTLSGSDFTPPVSNLKPIRGADPGAYENFASLCRQNYPEYELLFCIGKDDDAARSVLEKLLRDFPDRNIRVFVGSDRVGPNDKAAKLARLTDEARYEVLVINDSDVRVDPDYFRTIVAPLRDPRVGAVTCLYAADDTKNFSETVDFLGIISDFFPSIISARLLDGVKFALGTTIATTRSQLAQFGGYDTILNRPADDLLIGRFIAEQGRQVELLPYSVQTVSDGASFRQMFRKHLRWTVVLRHMRPVGHFGLLFTFGLPWTIAAIVVHPSIPTAFSYGGMYLILRLAITEVVGGMGLQKKDLWKKLPLVVIWDAISFFLWLASFSCQSIHWRDGRYRIREGQLVPVPADE